MDSSRINGWDWVEIIVGELANENYSFADFPNFRT